MFAVVGIIIMLKINVKRGSIMIDFNNSNIFKLNPTSINEGIQLVQPMLINSEEVFASFKALRDMVVFTNKRVIAINVQGITGKKKDFTSLPYSKVQAFSIMYP